MYCIKIFFGLCFGVSVGVSAMESLDRYASPIQGHNSPKPIERLAATTEFHKQAEQVKINPPVIVQQPLCSHGQHLENGRCVADALPPPPVCSRGQHLENGYCVADVVILPPICSHGEHLENGYCVADAPPPPVCSREQHLEHGVCVANVVIQPPTNLCPVNTHLVYGACVKNMLPPPPNHLIEKPREKSAVSVEKNNQVLQKNAEQVRKNIDAPAGKSVEHPTDINKPRKISGKVQPCNGGFIPVEEECTPSSVVKPVITADDFAKRMGIAYCKENPEECGVVSMERFKAARSEGIAYCKKDPLLCDLYSREQVEAAKKEGIAQCQKFPSLCGLTRIDVVATPKH